MFRATTRGCDESKIDTDLQTIDALVKAAARGEISPERIRDKLPTNVVAYEAIEFRMCLEYANGVYSAEEYRAFIEAKSGLLPGKDTRKSPLKEGVSAAGVRQQIVQYIEESNAILRVLDSSPTKVSQQSKEMVSGWITTVQKYIDDNFADPVYPLRFKNFAGMPSPGLPAHVVSWNVEYQNIRAAVLLRITRLNQFLDVI